MSAFVKVSNLIINLDAIAFIEVNEKDKVVTVLFSVSDEGNQQPLSLYFRDADAESFMTAIYRRTETS